jgi:2-polyprenyl-3-methyl-5-hydroxy-6-metoxy-1,4-benzoquinol methylase
MEKRMTDVATCPICGEPATAARVLRRTECRHARNGTLSVRLVECICKHVFIHPQPSSQELAPFYQSDYHVFANGIDEQSAIDQIITGKLRGNRLNHALVVNGGRYLDIGCGLGEMVAAMARLGVEAEGVEPGAPAVERARGKGLKVFHGTLHDARFADETFDSVSMYHVLEHVPDPISVLTECRRILKPTGELFIGVPNFDSLLRNWVGWNWAGIDAPRHLHHFRAESIRRAASRAGLKVVDLDTESLPESIEVDFADFLRKRALIPRRVTLKSHVARPLARYLATKGSTSGRGDALNLHLVRDVT